MADEGAVNVLSLFSGIGGFDRGLEAAGHTVIGQVENDAFCQRILAARWPGVPRWGDVRGVQLAERRGCSAINRLADAPSESGAGVDLLVGGFPCQDLSVAGKRAGLGGSRSSLFYEYVRIAQALRPPWGIVENVPGLLSSRRGADFALVLDGLRECWPAVGYRILDSQYFGVPQRRRRVFLVGGPTGAGVAQVLALGEGGGGDSPAGGEAGADVAGTLVGGVAGSRSHGKPSGSDRREIVIGARPELAYALAAGAGGSKFGSGRDGQDTFVHALTGEGHDASEDGTGRGTPLVVGTLTSEAADTRHGHQGFLNNQAVDSGHVLPVSNGVRRLTPVECERLQGFPDGWTCLCQPLTAYADDPDAAALACRCPDSPRYRALGNAVTVSVLAWLGKRLLETAGA